MKDATQKNVVLMSQYDRVRAAPMPSGTLLLNDCRDMAASQLSLALARVLAKAVDDLFEHSENATGFEMRKLYVEAMSLARDRHDIIEAAFRRHFVQTFTRETRREKNSQSAGGKLNLDELSLVEPDDLEESLAASNIANSIHDACGEELFGLEKRMGVLLNDPELEHTDNPLGPEIISRAFTDALKEQTCPVKIRLLLVTVFSKRMPGEAKDIYQDINQHLVEKGILPKIRVGMKKRQEPAPTAGTPGPAGVAPAAGQALSGEPGLFAALQQLMGSGVAGGGFPQGGMMFGGASPQGASVVSALTRLQHGQPEGIGGTLDAAALADGHVNVLHRIKASGVAATMGQVDAMTLDIVAMLFDYILDDRRIPDSMKALIGRLQIPVLKVAMLDKTFFSQKSHPARRLLDVLADASVGWDEGEGHQGGLYRKVSDGVQRILNEFDDKIGIFAEVLAEIEGFLTDEKRHAAELAGRSAQVIHHKEQAEIARIVAHDEVARRMQTPGLPGAIRDFLSGCWERVLTEAYAKTGEGGISWNGATETMDDLVWSVAPKAAPDDRKKLVGLLPSLLKRLQDGMRLVDFPGEERDRFFSTLVKCHAEAVKSGLRPVDEAAAPMPAAEIQTSVEAVPAVQQSEEPADFVEVALPPETVESDPELVRDIVAEEAPAPAMQLEDIGEVRRQGGPDEGGDEYDAMVKRLKRGTWIEFEQENGAMVRSKLAWVSPLKGLYLFTNRLGERAVSITPVGLAAKLRNGQAFLIEDVALVDRAVSSLLERLQQNAVPSVSD